MNIYLWKEDIEDGESVITAEYRPVEYGKDYDVVNNPDKFQLYIDGKEIKWYSPERKLFVNYFKEKSKDNNT